jgi:hypothetical protein
MYRFRLFFFSIACSTVGTVGASGSSSKTECTTKLFMVRSTARRQAGSLASRRSYCQYAGTLSELLNKRIGYRHHIHAEPGTGAVYLTHRSVQKRTIRKARKLLCKPAPTGTRPQTNIFSSRPVASNLFELDAFMNEFFVLVALPAAQVIGGIMKFSS